MILSYDCLYVRTYTLGWKGKEANRFLRGERKRREEK